MSDQEISVTVNGERVRVPPAASVSDVVRSFGLDPDHARGIAVALNEEVVRRQDWPETAVGPDDSVEIVTAQQGG